MLKERIPLRATVALLLCATLAGCGGGGSSGSSGTPSATTYSDPTEYTSGPGASLPSARELSSVTHQQLVLNGATLEYTATAGHLTASDPVSHTPEASFFYVAYTLDGAPLGSRPVTFFYNGGPGSASIYLHLGSFGPMRLETGDPSTAKPAPFPLLPNTQSLLDVTDMVFVDAIGTGFSEAIAPSFDRTYWGVDADAAVFRDFVMRYIAVNGRSASPKYLFGESYGTTRSAVLANLLEIAGMKMNGVVLQSSILNYNANCGVATNSGISCAGYLPTYGAVGAWYNLDVPNPAPADLPDYVAQMRLLTTQQYAPAIAQFKANGTLPATTFFTTLVNSTGLPAAQWQAHFNLQPSRFAQGLVPGTLLGFYDARINAPFGSALAGRGDPSDSFITPGFADAVNGYLANTLGYTTPSAYVLTSNAINLWNFTHDGQALPDTVPDLAAALTLNPQLKVLSLNGYHDLVTPFFLTETDLARLGPSPNVATHFYVGGHMTYLDDGSIVLEKSDLAQFYSATQAATE
jgi:carboxypeptidase C (cathepsin A)